MKKIFSLVCGFLIFYCATRCDAQGTVIFNNHVSGLTTHVYSPEPDGLEQSGNGINDVPSGTTVYTGTLIGGTSTGTYAGQYFTAQLWAYPGSDVPESALQPVTQYTTTFRTVAAGGGFVIAPQLSSDPGIPGTQFYGGTATLQLRVWDNEGLSVNNWVEANNNALHGASPTFTLTGLGASPSTLNGLQSFSLNGPLTSIVPEPSTLVLLGLGASYFGLHRRKKK